MREVVCCLRRDVITIFAYLSATFIYKIDIQMLIKNALHQVTMSQIYNP